MAAFALLLLRIPSVAMVIWPLGGVFPMPFCKVFSAPAGFAVVAVTAPPSSFGDPSQADGVSFGRCDRRTWVSCIGETEEQIDAFFQEQGPSLCWHISGFYDSRFQTLLSQEYGPILILVALDEGGLFLRDMRSSTPNCR